MRRDDYNLSGLGTTLKALRLKHKLSQEELARLSDVARSTIARIELGTTQGYSDECVPKTSTLIKLAKAFSMSLDQFLPKK